MEQTTELNILNELCESFSRKLSELQEEMGIELYLVDDCLWFVDAESQKVIKRFWAGKYSLKEPLYRRPKDYGYRII